jgi:hypothetical protein
MRPDVAEAFDRMAAAAREEAGLFLSINRAFRSNAADKAVRPQTNPHLLPPHSTAGRQGTASYPRKEHSASVSRAAPIKGPRASASLA